MKKKMLFGLLVTTVLSVGFTHRVHAEESQLNITPRIIIGDDNREQVPNEQLDQEPYRWTVFLDITYADGTRYYASGAMISKDTVLTCGHALFKSNLNWATDVKVHAGYDGGNNKYYARSTEILGISSWTRGADMDYMPDIAAIKLDRNLGEQTGWFPIQKDVLLQDEITVTGFPGTKNKTMWTDNGVVTKQYRHGIGYNADSDQGNSGCPVYNQNNELVAIHSGALKSTSLGDHNTGTGFTDEVKKVVDYWVTGQADVPVTSVSLSDQQITLEKGSTYQLRETVLPTNAFYKEGKWKSSNTSIATVDYQGRVTAKNKGKATITFATDDQKKEASCEVIVNAVGHVPVEDVQFSYSDEVENEEKGNIFSTRSPTFVPSNATNKEIYYTSSDKDILDMDLKDPYSPRYRKAGTVDIYCHSRDNGKQYKVKTVKVDDHGEDIAWATPIESGITQNGYFYKQSDVDYFKFIPKETKEYTIDGEAFDGKESAELNKYWEFMIWDEKGKHIFTSHNRNFSYSFEAGKTYYLLPRLLKYAHIKDEDYKTNYIFNVFPKGAPTPKPITEIKLSRKKLEIALNEKDSLQVEVTPEDTTYSKNIEWSSSDESVATVNNGEVTGIKEGTAKITAKAMNGITAVCEVKVKKVVIPLEDMTFPYSEKILDVEKGYDFPRYAPTFIPRNATNQEYYYTSSNKKVLDLTDDPLMHKKHKIENLGETEVYCYSESNEKTYKVTTYRVDDHGSSPETATSIASGVSQKAYFYGKNDVDCFKFIPLKTGEYTLDAAVLGEHKDKFNQEWEIVIKDDENNVLSSLRDRYSSCTFEVGKTYYITPKIRRDIGVGWQINYIFDIFPKGSERPKSEAEIVPVERIDRDPYSNLVLNFEKETTVSKPIPHFVPTNASNKQHYYTSSNPDILDLRSDPKFYSNQKLTKSGEADVYCHSEDNGQAYKLATYRVDDHGSKPETATVFKEGISHKGVFYNVKDIDYFKFTPSKSGEYTIDGAVLDDSFKEFYEEYLNREWSFDIKDENDVLIKNFRERYATFNFEAGKTYYIVPKLQRDHGIKEPIRYVFDVFPKGTPRPESEATIVPVEKLDHYSSDRITDIEKGDGLYKINPVVYPSNASNKQYTFKSSNKKILDLTDDPHFTKKYEAKESGDVELLARSEDNDKDYRMTTFRVDDHGKNIATATTMNSAESQNGVFYSVKDVDYFKFNPAETGEYTVDGVIIDQAQEYYLNREWEYLIKDENDVLITTLKGRYSTFNFEAGKTYYIVPKLIRDLGIKVPMKYVFDIFPKGTERPKSDYEYVPVEKIERYYPYYSNNIEKGGGFSVISYKFTPANVSNTRVTYSSSNKKILDFSDDPTFAKSHLATESGEVDLFIHSDDNGEAYNIATFWVDDHGNKPTTTSVVESGITQNGIFYDVNDLDYFKFSPTKSQSYTLDGNITDGQYRENLNRGWQFLIKDENDVLLTTLRGRDSEFTFEAGKNYYVIPKLSSFLGIKDRQSYTLDIYPKGEPKPIPITEIKLDQISLEMDEGTKQTLQATITPDDTTNSKDIEWSSSDDSIATVNNGEITGVKEGKVTITAKTSNGKTATCEVTVNKVVIPVERIELYMYTTDLVKSGEFRQVEAIIHPENATNQEVEWSIADETIATISDKSPGLKKNVSPLKLGSTTVTAKIGDVSSKITVNVVEDAEYLNIDQILEPGEVYETELEFPNVDGKEVRFYGQGYIWIPNAHVDIYDSKKVHYNKDYSHCVFGIGSQSKAGEKVKIRIVNKDRYRSGQIKMKIRAYPFTWQPHPTFVPQIPQ
ncbi:hypothetical protein NRIC_35780 [Enterococcus florum]|uniref:Serine protease n=1 Tax=Enterococcus florum TaxID=2480627 RepID=A0A4P5PBX0_9ENTE|nr:Ig-like domain-containing protein [Enterococcus florum]GCF95687.1 hypothetical protein NRIC_35780 [Enterococcus florum]